MHAGSMATMRTMKFTHKLPAIGMAKLALLSAQQMHTIYMQCNFSKPNTLGTKEMVQFREVFGLERFCMYSKYREQDLKTCPV